jgi:hypothetical protein
VRRTILDDTARAMDNDTLKLIARLKIAAARLQLQVDVVRFVADPEYAQQSLLRYADMADEEGVVLALQLIERLGLGVAPFKPAAPPPVPAPPRPSSRRRDVPPAPLVREDESRYVGRLR